MASRGGKSRDASTAASGPKGKPPTALQIWLEDAWAGWLKHVSLIGVAALLFVMYQLEFLNQRFLGILIGFGLGLGAIIFAATPAREHATSPGKKAALYGLCAVWAICAGYPVTYGLFPGQPYATAVLSDEGSASKPLDVPNGGKSLYVKGHLKGGGGDVTANFHIKGSWQGGNASADGALGRVITTGRVGRRGTARGATEFTERRVYLGRTKGPLTLTLESKDESLEKELDVEVLWGPVVPPLVIYVLSGLVFVFALALDRKLDPKGRTALGISAAVSLVFATYYGFEQVSRNNIVRPAIGSILLAFIAGGIGSWLITAVVKKMTPEKKRRSARA